MHFFPTGPFTTVYALCVLAVVLWALFHDDKTVRRIVGVVFLSWLLARTATYYDSLLIQSGGTFALALASLTARTRMGDLVAILLACKLPIYGAHAIGWLAVEAMWAGSEAVSYIILAVSLGGLSNGGLGVFRPLDFLSGRSRVFDRLAHLYGAWR